MFPASLLSYSCLPVLDRPLLNYKTPIILRLNFFQSFWAPILRFNVRKSIKEVLYATLMSLLMMCSTPFLLFRCLLTTPTVSSSHFMHISIDVKQFLLYPVIYDWTNFALKILIFSANLVADYFSLFVLLSDNIISQSTLPKLSLIQSWFPG